MECLKINNYRLLIESLIGSSTSNLVPTKKNDFNFTLYPFICLPNRALGLFELILSLKNLGKSIILNSKSYRRGQVLYKFVGCGNARRRRQSRHGLQASISLHLNAERSLTIEQIANAIVFFFFYCCCCCCFYILQCLQL